MNVSTEAAVAAPQTEQLELTLESQQSRRAHDLLLMEMEAKKRSFGLIVPTLPQDIHKALRDLQEPIRLFGENPADVRDRLRMCMARRLVVEESQAAGGIGTQQQEQPFQAFGIPSGSKETDEKGGTKYTHASAELIQARERIAEYSLPRAKARLLQERKRRRGSTLLVQREQRRSKYHRRGKAMGADNEDDNDEEMIETEEELEVKTMNENCGKLYRYTRDESALECSQYGGDNRPLSAISCGKHFKPGGGFVVATGGWSGSIKLWDAHSGLRMMGMKQMAHEDRIMGVALSPSPDDQDDSFNWNRKQMLATASIDLTAKLWSISLDQDEGTSTDETNYSLKELAHLKGHQARLCKVAWHPSGRYVGTTSFDHTWRLWDVETSQPILLQDGHWRECYGISMNHPDGSLCSTTDFGGVVQLWDLRTGKSIAHYLGHAKRVLCTEFSPMGFHLATAGDDGMIKIWDLRKRSSSSASSSGKQHQQAQFASIPAHTKLINQLKFAPHHGESLVSSSFDGTARVWSTRNYKMLTTLRGHEGKVMGADFVEGGNGVVTVGYDKTLKLWS